MRLQTNHLLVFIISLLYVTPGLSQDQTIDRLRAVIASSAKEEEKLTAYIQLSGKLSLISFNETIKIAERGIELASVKKDSLAYAELSRNMGTAYYFKGEYEKAATLYFTAARIYEQAGKEQPLAYVYNDIAKLYRKNRDLKRAGQNYEKALAIFRSLKDSSGIQMILNESGVLFEYQGNYTEALKRYNASLQIAKRLNDEMGKSWCYSFIAGVHVLQNDYESAANYNLQSLAIRQKLNDTFAITLSFSDLGVMYSAWGKPERAYYYFEQSNQIAEKMGYKELLSNNYAEMSKLANVTGNYKNALDYFTWHTQLKDSIFTAQKNRQVEELSTLYETNKREQQIQGQQLTIKKRNSLIIVILIVSTLALLVLFLLYNRYKWKQQTRMQIEILKQQELAAKAILEAEEKERSRIAKDLHDGVGQMMSAARMNLSSFYNHLQVKNNTEDQSLLNIIQLVDDSCKEVRAVSHSMMPAALLSKGLPHAVEELVSKINGSALKVSFHNEGFESRLDSTTETIVYRVIQECVNNTIKHAEATELDIALLCEAGNLSVTVEDNGKGFAYNILDNDDDGMGLKNIRSRIQFLKGTIDFHSAPGKGTLVAIHVPVNTSLIK